MAVTVHDIVEAIFVRAPRELAEPWDNVGLVVGDAKARVRRAVLCVDATASVVAEARAARAQLIVAHHPLFVEPIKHVRADEDASAVAYHAARAVLSVCCMHTNLDYAPGGLCVELARVVGLGDIRPLSSAGASAFYKLAVFVPPSHLAAVRAAISEAAGGHIGYYEECSFGVAGEGTYRPLPGAKPYTGTVGRLERAAEVRLEMSLPRSSLSGALSAMTAAHPYEEPAFDVYPLANAWPQSARGALGKLPRATSAASFAARAGGALRASGVRVSGDERRRIRLVAVGSGSAGHLAGEAVAGGADAVLLGEIRHADALRAAARGLTVIELGHFATERPAVALMRRWLEQDLAGRIEVIPSRVEVEPLRGLPAAGGLAGAAPPRKE
jgi:dinuclear metal center YbgI/SA1388 family protein